MIMNTLSPPEQLVKFILEKWISKPIYAAAELGIADLLDQGPLSIDELAQHTGTKASFLYRVMRALASVGIFSEIEEQKFQLTPMAEYLKEGALRSMVLLFHSDWNDKAWEYLLHALYTGNTPFEAAHGLTLQSWLEKNTQMAHLFNQANAIKAATSHRAIIESYDFSRIHTLVDVGGGTGALMAEILTAYPELNGIVADIPSVVVEAEKTIQIKGIEDRCKTVACDFFKDIPSGGDAYLLSNILHDWPDDKCKKILKVCRRVLKPKTRLLIVEMVIPPGNETSLAKLLDIEMLVMTGGRERTEAEYDTLLKESGFQTVKCIPTKESICIIEGIRL